MCQAQRHSSWITVYTQLLTDLSLAEQKAKEAALIPKGMRMMEDEERQEMLAALEANKAEIEGQIQVQPAVTAWSLC